MSSHTRLLATLTVIVVISVFGIYISKLNYSDDSVRLEIVQLLEDGDYRSVAAMLENAQSLILTGGAGDSDLARMMYAFSSSNPGLLSSLQEWLDKSPESSLAHLAMGLYLKHLAYLHRGRDYIGSTSPEQISGQNQYLDKAAIYFRKSAALDASNTLAWTFLAELPNQLRPYELTTTKLLDIHAPYSETAWFNTLFNSQPKWGGSHQDIKKLLVKLENRIVLNPRLAELRGFNDYANADIHLLKRDYKNSKSACEKLLKGSRHPSFLHLCAKTYTRLENHSEALELIDEAIVYSPDDTSLFEQRAKILRKLGRMEEAYEMLDQALRFDTLDPETLQQKALYLLTQDRISESLEVLERAKIYGNGDADMHVLISRAYYKSSQYHKAVESAKRAIELSPNESTPLRHLTNAYNKLLDCKNLQFSATTYLASCNINKDCSEHNINWIHEVLQAIEVHPSCEKWRRERTESIPEVILNPSVA